MEKALTDSEIVQALFDRKEEIFTEVEKRYGKRCLATAENILNNREDAKECVNDAYMKLWNLIPPNRPQILGTYLCKLVKYTAIDMLKSRLAYKRGGGAFSLVLDELSECIPDKINVERAAESRETIEKINKFLRESPEESRRIFILRYWYCCEISDIAKRLGMRKNHVSVILSRTRSRLREYLEKEGLEP